VFVEKQGQFYNGGGDSQASNVFVTSKQVGRFLGRLEWW
jgi:hypothetical protein